jgi:hypothetical protein
MKELDFYEVVQIRETPTARDLHVAHEVGVVVGKAAEGKAVSYAVLIGDETYSLDRSDLRPTGNKLTRQELYGGGLLHVSLDGQIVAEPSSSDDLP